MTRSNCWGGGGGLMLLKPHLCLSPSHLIGDGMLEEVPAFGLALSTKSRACPWCQCVFYDTLAGEDGSLLGLVAG